MLILISYQIYFQGDPDYSKYWNEVEKHPDKHTALDIWDGLKRLNNENTILHTFKSFLTGAKVTNPKAMPPMKTFGAGRTRYQNIILTKNSPLFPLFAKAATKSFENGHDFRDQLLKNLPTRNPPFKTIMFE